MQEEKRQHFDLKHAQYGNKNTFKDHEEFDFSLYSVRKIQN